MREKNNSDIKSYMAKNYVSQYDLSVVLGCSTSTIYRLLQRNLSNDEKIHIKELIDTIINSKEE